MGTVEVLLAHLKSEGKLLELTSLQDTKARVFKFSEEYSKSAILEDTGLAAGVYELTVARLRQSLDNLHKQKDLLAEKIAARKLDAKQLIRAGKKKLAVLRLRSKKQLEVYEKQLFGKMLNVERLLDAVVEATLNKQMLHSLESSNATLNDLTSQVAIEDVEDVLDENADLLSRLQAVDELLGQDLTFTEAEEQSLQDQLAELLSNDAPAIEEGKDVLSPRPQQQLNTSTTSVSTTQEGLQLEDRKQQLVVRPSTDKKRAIILS
jgi:hypothetical protein